MARSENEALREVVNANTAALKKIRVDLTACNNADKVAAIMADVELAMQDLSMTSQKVDVALRHVNPQQQQQAQVGYGQYPVGRPINDSNPVPWPPGYSPPDDSPDAIMTLKYSYHSHGGIPPVGFCYQTASEVLLFHYKDAETNNNMTFLQAVAIGDTISVNGVTWTILAIEPPKGSAFRFTVTPAMPAPPYGDMAFTFDRTGG
jgi:hypothetical protein